MCRKSRSPLVQSRFLCVGKRGFCVLQIRMSCVAQLDSCVEFHLFMRAEPWFLCAEEHDFSPIAPDLAEIAVTTPGLSAEEARELPTATRSPPSGWRQDTFPPRGGAIGVLRRTV